MLERLPETRLTLPAPRAGPSLSSLEGGEGNIDIPLTDV